MGKRKSNEGKSLRSRILYDDNHIIIVNKLPGEIVQGDKTGDKPLSDNVKEYLKKKYQKKGNVFLGVVHRIDRPVGGAVVFAKTSKALSRLNKMLQDGKISKTYWAVVRQAPKANEGHLVHFMSRNPQKNKSTAHNEQQKERKRAELKYRKVAKSDHYTLLEIELLTGRHHQIRAQLSKIGCPIKGDLKYGFPRNNNDASIHLHAIYINFVHPVNNEIINITAPPPEEKLWSFFKKHYLN
jgi:23S rRNA pseudouridine1911/1915/1917 synthase